MSSPDTAQAPTGPVPPTPTVPSVPVEIANLPPDQIAAILRNIPDVFKNLGDTDLKEVASTLSQLSGTAPPAPAPLYPPPVHVLEPGPSSHPRGPPDLGEIGGPPQQQQQQQQQPMQGSDDMEDGDLLDENGMSGGSAGGRRGSRSATMSNDEWTRQRKDNHKEVERRRRGNINEGINELGRIVPNGTGEKAKGAILQRAVQYIHHLKENEARNIEKWTLEKLLMDQAMGDLQAQLEEMRRHWEEERQARNRAENELEVLRGVTGQAAPGAMAAKRKTPEGDSMDGEDPKRQRLD